MLSAIDRNRCPGSIGMLSGINRNRCPGSFGIRIFGTKFFDKRYFSKSFMETSLLIVVILSLRTNMPIWYKVSHFHFEKNYIRKTWFIRIVTILLNIRVDMLLVIIGLLNGMKNAAFLSPVLILSEAVILSQRINI